ncbi:hypothetical protein COLO4_08530 [Corchorus olitorius]|uniref:Uncharacterized protein n=1 Tax=Corchorus olitorius TaxID=93759 RepID=A0A1R3KFG1_9ROSI|nr:hypothetical protein COLO4_08530 [Corchorus olitorius]
MKAKLLPFNWKSSHRRCRRNYRRRSVPSVPIKSRSACMLLISSDLVSVSSKVALKSLEQPTPKWNSRYSLNNCQMKPACRKTRKEQYGKTKQGKGN